jgi:pectate lyase
MKASLLLSLLPVAQAAVIDTRQSKTGDGKQGDTDATQGDLSQRPPPRFPFPITKFPVAKETVVLKNAKYIMPGEVFDGKMKRYERPEGSCNEQAEGTDADTVFNLLPGSTIRNVIIGKNQAEGIHALGDAWVENGEQYPVSYGEFILINEVWWEDVCEDALTSKGLNTQLRVIGGGARSATDKV